jgi:hypothetical protein
VESVSLTFYVLMAIEARWPIQYDRQNDLGIVLRIPCFAPATGIIPYVQNCSHCDLLKAPPPKYLIENSVALEWLLPSV